MTRNESQRTALLFQPPIYDTQYWAEWSQPSGLLKVGSWLKELGYKTGLFDCLAAGPDREVPHHVMKVVRICSKDEIPLDEFQERRKGKGGKAPGMGHLAADERLKYCFGIPLKSACARLERHANPPRPLFEEQFRPDEVWITSIMTYWWESTLDSVVALKRLYPRAAFRIGGIYPTLASQHLQGKLRERGLDFKVLSGRNLRIESRVVAEPDCIVIGEVPGASWKPLDFELYQKPLWSDTGEPEIPTYCILTTSRGCPYDCSYCAQKAYNEGLLKIRRKPWTDALADIREKYHKYNIKEFAFYEDNFLLSRDNLVSLLQAIEAAPDLKHLQLYAPEGFEVRLLAKEEELLRLMKKCGFQSVYLPLENVHNQVIRSWNRKHCNLSMYNDAVELAAKVGYKLRDMEVNSFVLFGMPDEQLDNIVDTVLYASDKVGSVIPMLYSPVPGSQMYEEQKEYLHNVRGYDLQHLNGKLYPYLEYNYEKSGITLRDYMGLESLMFRLNAKAKGESFHFVPENRVFKALQKHFERLLKGKDPLLSSPSHAEQAWQTRGSDRLRPCLGLTESPLAISISESPLSRDFEEASPLAGE